MSQSELTTFSLANPVPEVTLRLERAGVESPRFEAQLLVGLALGISRSAVTATLFSPLSLELANRLEALVRERENRVPFAYLRGNQEFYGREFLVSPDVLIPRPETELLIDFALQKFPSANRFDFADIGSGSGCIGLTLLSERPLSRGSLIDLSDLALLIARKNAENLGVESRAEFLQSDLLSNSDPQTFDLILSNPPYIRSGDLRDLQPEVGHHEPRMALDGGNSGIDLYPRLIEQAMFALRPSGWLAVELGAGQSEAVEKLFESAGFHSVESQVDFANIRRVTLGQKR